jgi:glycosyltransferase involved in cell wall biosynthesis
MRIAYVSSDPGVPVFGSKGCSIHVQELLRFFLQEVGAEVWLYTPRPDGNASSEFLNVVVRRSESVGGVPRERERRLLKLNEDVLSHLHADGPFDLVYERYSLFGRAGMSYARHTSTPGVLEVNAPLMEEQSRYRELFHEAEAAQTTRQAFEDASSIVAVSDEVKAYVDALCQTPQKIHVVPNGVDVDRFWPDVRAIRPRSPDTFTVGFVGSLKPWHGLGDLVEAFRLLRSEIPKSRLLLVGDGPERASIEASLEKSDLTDVAFITGAVAHREVPGWLTSMDVAVAPYPQETGCYFSPLKIFEYMAAGLPVVATRAGQIPHIVEHGTTGVLTHPGRPSELASALAQLGRDPRRAAAMARVARDRAVSRYTWSAIGRRTLGIAGMQVGSEEVLA